MLTEEEAKRKWCPHAVASHTDPRRGFRDEAGQPAFGSVPPEFPCIASACMAWRWRRRYADDAKEAKISHVTGYCGLSGKP